MDHVKEEQPKLRGEGKCRHGESWVRSGLCQSFDMVGAQGAHTRHEEVKVDEDTL